MKEVKLQQSSPEVKSVYEFTRREFSGILKGLMLHGHPAERALILSHDPWKKIRPRARPMSLDVERLAGITDKHDLIDSNAELTKLDVLRNEREDVVRAVRHPESGLKVTRDTIYLGVFTTAVAFDSLRAPLALQAQPSKEESQLLTMMDQFYADGVDRLMDRV